ncbi:16S rRNA (guanine(966)-N(2))-methyltransferase RsmD [Mycoavidus sp. SF9855]|uniref:16S rRNA (guanine(966)-N(2))-methyltransferase RsmD n=1 Tax=Mycoavidus sp. SF9855 TaxID=2968475 RepID=UPI00211BAA44|nr:16S rRNA (guanine(966)-N(2))-methyltransferase RsmD [Mycoavidus sp. SF9855]UUM21409.1 16S rRNA (guanine(966)-N(2))-methyltransferase RsmD [Mycoavidus sp. SF9855]
MAISSEFSTAAARTRAAAHSVRIIGGAWKRTHLPVLDMGELRPTPDRVRETLFNWLGQGLDGLVCLDLFAGSGALGFEAASRGAARVLMVERQLRIVQQLRCNREKLAAQTIEIVHADALKFACGLAAGSFDLIFLDPPFATNLLEPALKLCMPLVRIGGAIYIESSRSLARGKQLVLPTDAISTGDPSGLALTGEQMEWSVVRHGRAGAVHYHLLRRLASQAGDILPSDGETA